MIGFELALNFASRLHSLVLVATQGKMPTGSLERMRGYAENLKNRNLEWGWQPNNC